MCSTSKGGARKQMLGLLDQDVGDLPKGGARGPGMDLEHRVRVMALKQVLSSTVPRGMRPRTT